MNQEEPLPDCAAASSSRPERRVPLGPAPLCFVPRLLYSVSAPSRVLRHPFSLARRRSCCGRVCVTDTVLCDAASALLCSSPLSVVQVAAPDLSECLKTQAAGKALTTSLLLAGALPPPLSSWDPVHLCLVSPRRTSPPEPRPQKPSHPPTALLPSSPPAALLPCGLIAPLHPPPTLPPFRCTAEEYTTTVSSTTESTVAAWAMG